jgi:hypothetical protein
MLASGVAAKGRTAAGGLIAVDIRALNLRQLGAAAFGDQEEPPAR